MRHVFWGFHYPQVIAANCSFRDLLLASTLSWQDVMQRYRQSIIGPFWITLSMAIQIATIGFVFSYIFHLSVSEYIPFLVVGIILWTLISTTISEGCFCFIESEAIIKQLPIPLFVHVLRVIWRNALILLHNALIVPSIFVIFGKFIHKGLVFVSFPLVSPASTCRY